MGLYSWALNVSDTYIYHSNGPSPANEVFTRIIKAVRDTKDGNLDKFNNAIKATKKFIPKYNLPTKTLNKDSGLDYTDPGKVVKYYRGNQLLVFIDTKYEFTYNIDKDFLSILIKNDGKLFYYKNTVKNLTQVSNLIKSNMSGLCVVDEKNPQNSPDVIEQVDAGRSRNMSIDRTKIDLPENTVNIIELNPKESESKENAASEAFGKIVDKSALEGDEVDAEATG